MPANTPRGITYPLYTDPLSGIQSDFQEMAEDLDTLTQQLVDRIAAAEQRPSAKISDTAIQAVAANTDVTMTFTNENYDNASMVDLGTDNTRIQITERGMYLVTAQITFATAAGSWGCLVRINSSAGFIANPVFQSIQGSSTVITYSSVASLHFATGAVTDNITLTARQNSGGPVDVTDRVLAVSKVSTTLGSF